MIGVDAAVDESHAALAEIVRGSAARTVDSLTAG
jgi:hypothetical protein